MDFHELRAFAALARHLHFARAAAAVNTSPSALSRILSRLEEETGTRLFERDTRRVVLTEAGQVFLGFAEESLSRFDSLHLTLQAESRQLRGTLRIYASVTACYSILPPLVEALGRTHPDLKLAIQTGDPADAEPVLINGEADLALTALPVSGLDTPWCFSVRKTPLVFVSRTADAPKEELPLEDQSLILPQRGLARERYDRWARKQKQRPRIAAEAAGNEAVLALARLGLGYGLVPQIVLENSPFAEGLAIHPAEEGFGDYDIGFVLPHRPTGLTPRLKEALKDLLSQVYPNGSWM